MWTDQGERAPGRPPIPAVLVEPLLCLLGNAGRMASFAVFLVDPIDAGLARVCHSGNLGERKAKALSLAVIKGMGSAFPIIKKLTLN